MFTSYNTSCDGCGCPVRMGERCGICASGRSDDELASAQRSEQHSGQAGAGGAGAVGGPITFNGVAFGMSLGILFCLVVQILCAK